MKITIYLGPNEKTLNGPINKCVSGFIHKCLGENNKWHDSFSPYCVSQVTGGQLIDGVIQYPNGGRLCVSSDDNDFISDFIAGLKRIESCSIATMPVIRCEISEQEVTNKGYDIVYADCVALSQPHEIGTKKFYNTVNNTENFLEMLNEHSIRKLKAYGIPASIAETLKLEPYHKERWTEKYVKFDSQSNIFVPTSRVKFIMRGNELARLKMLNLGFGQSTGAGFGFATRYSNNINKNKNHESKSN